MRYEDEIECRHAINAVRKRGCAFVMQGNNTFLVVGADLYFDEAAADVEHLSDDVVVLLMTEDDSDIVSVVEEP